MSDIRLKVETLQRRTQKLLKVKELTKNIQTKKKKNASSSLTNIILSAQTVALGSFDLCQSLIDF